MQALRIFIDSGGALWYTDYEPDSPVIKESGSLMEKCIPKELIVKYNKQENRVYLINGSTVTFTGAESESYVGANMDGVLISELSLHKTNTLGLLAPIINESHCFLILNGTHRGFDNQLYTIINKTKGLSSWFTSYRTAMDSKLVYWDDPEGEYQINLDLKDQKDPMSGLTYTNLQDDIDAGMTSRNLVIREYMNIPLDMEESSYYVDQLRYLANNNHIRDDIVYDPTKVAYTSWDLGKNDKTCICFCQITDEGNLNIFDFYENTGKVIDHYINIVQQKPYTYGAHIAPFDIAKTSMTSARSVAEYAEDEFGFRFEILGNTQVVKADIELVRTKLPICYFNKKTTVDLLRSLQTYHENIKTGKPDHKNSDAADSFRYLIKGYELNMLQNTLAYQNQWSPFAMEDKNPERCCRGEDLHRYTSHMGMETTTRRN